LLATAIGTWFAGTDTWLFTDLYLSRRNPRSIEEITNRLAARGVKTLPAAVERLQTSGAHELGCLLMYFNKLGPVAGPELEKAYAQSTDDIVRLKVLWAIQVCSGEKSVIPRYHELLFSRTDYASGGAQLRLRVIEGASHPYFQLLASCKSADKVRENREQLDKEFSDWWREGQNHIKWISGPGEHFEVVGSSGNPVSSNNGDQGTRSPTLPTPEPQEDAKRQETPP